MNRRDFFILSTVFLAGCAAPDPNGAPPSAGVRTLNAGPASQYDRDGVYTRFVHQGCFIVRRGDSLFAVSSICTHRKCKLKAEPDRSFYCPCHGSTFSAEGRVLTGPARRDLPHFEVSTDAAGNLLVTIPLS